jgi:hypothetical protein
LLSLIFNVSVQAETFHAYINGGHTEGSNTWIHEQDILSFKNGLFGRRSTILSADGINAKYSETDGNSNFLRRPDGYVSLNASGVGPGVQPATMENIQGLYRQIRETKPANAVVVFGDHGDKTGLSLYHGSSLSTKDHFNLQNTLPAGTSFKGVYLQCFAGSLLVDQTRALPEQPAGLMGFLDKYYPSNRCGVALSRHNEMGQYNNRGEGWNKSPWTDYFKKAKPPTLDGMAKMLNQDPGLAPGSVLTSNYFAEDLAKFFCGRLDKSEEDLEAAFNAVCNCKPPSNGISRLEDLSSALLKDLCRSRTSEAEKLAKEVGEKYDDWLSFAVLNAFWSQQFLAKKFPEMEKNIQFMNQKDYLAYQAEVETSPEKKQQLQKEAAALEGQIDQKMAARYRQELSALADSPTRDFSNYLKENCSAQWLNESPLVGQIIPPDAVQGFKAKKYQGGCESERGRAFADMRTTQARYKQAQLGEGARQGAILQKMLKDPRLSKVKDRYETIKNCEASSLR